MCSIVTDRSCVHEQGHLGGLVNVTAERHSGAYQSVMITSSLQNCKKQDNIYNILQAIM